MEHGAWSMEHRSSTNFNPCKSLIIILSRNPTSDFPDRRYYVVSTSTELLYGWEFAIPSTPPPPLLALACFADLLPESEWPAAAGQPHLSASSRWRYMSFVSLGHLRPFQLSKM
jgi:hypothetical protein